MFEIRIQDKRLNAHRLIRGRDKQDVEHRAAAQIAAWEQRWQSLKQKEQRGSSIYSAKSQAQELTRQASAEIQALETLLVEGCHNPILTWEDLKVSEVYSETPPTVAARPTLPPVPDAKLYTPTLTALDKLLVSRKRSKESDAKQKFDVLYSDWQRECRLIKEQYESSVSRFNDAQAAWEQRRIAHSERQQAQHHEIETLRAAYLEADKAAVEYFVEEVLSNSPYPDSFPQGLNIDFKPSNFTLGIDFELPDVRALPTIREVKFVASRSELQAVAVTESWRKATYDRVLYQIALRTLYEVWISEEHPIVGTIVFNGWVTSISPATGTSVHVCVLSVQAKREDFLRLDLTQVDPKACFRSLKGVASSKLIELTPIRPILQMNKEDARFIQPYAVAGSLDERTNLAAMDWQDFENLIRELFETEFQRSGGEVKITRASRDGGVDAIAYDPDPIRGGKIVIQAKRYTNTVGVSAVRDLFGTVQHEGAIKGILVTTATYGPDAYEFAKDKPLTLLSGAELLGLLERHGHRAKIDLLEARVLGKTTS